MPSYSFPILEKQKEFLQAQEFLTVFRAGIRSGKTHILTWWAVIHALQGSVIILMEPTYKMCRKVLWPTLCRHLQSIGMQEGRDYSTHKTDMQITLRSGGQIHCYSCDALDKMRGVEADLGGIDEYAQLDSDEALRVLMGRLSRGANAQIKLTGSPTAKGWVREVESRHSTKVIRQTMLENLFLPLSYINQQVIQYGQGSKWYAQEILGEIVSMDDGIFDVSRLPTIPAQPLHGRLVRAWDFASSAKTSADFTVGVLMSVQDGRYAIHDVTRLHGSFASIQSHIVNTMRQDPVGTQQLCESNGPGLTIISILRADPMLANTPIVPCTASSDKITRALPFSGAVAGGLVSIVQAPWNKAFTQELEAFSPKCEHDDQVDAVALAYNVLCKPPARYTSFNF